MDFLSFAYEAGPIKIVVWEVLYIIVLVLILSAALNKLLFQPVLAVLDERERRISGASEAQDELLMTVEAKSREQAERLAEARRGAVEAVETARREAEEVRSQQLATARGRADEKVAAAEARLREDVEKAEVELEREAKALSTRIASQVLGREVA